MASASGTTSRGAEIVGGALVCVATTLSVIAAGAGAVPLLRAGRPARRLLDFGFEGLPDSPVQMLELAAHNAALGAAILAAGVAVSHLPRARVVLTPALAFLLALNAGFVGVAIGAYGVRVTAAVGPHLPLEFGAFCLAGGLYLAALRTPVTPLLVAGTTGGCAALLLASAAVETYLSSAGR